MGFPRAEDRVGHGDIIPHHRMGSRFVLHKPDIASRNYEYTLLARVNANRCGAGKLSPF